ncbi:MAG: prolipoprotein diacylglyceryl transferase [Candidatus Faecousia sp.]|nr:prolipoprotein diacylglyceryl transferase [Candidatus Faecousia sp.]
MQAFTEISFPGLGISLNPSTGFSLGSLQIRWYGVIIALGLCLAVLYACRQCKEFGITEDDLIDGVLWVTPFAIVCARIYYCVFSWDQYAANPISCLYIWEGGLAIYGGIIGAAIGVLVFCKVKKLKPGAILDLVCLGFLIGQCIGRWGNFFNREAFGSTTDCFLRMGLLNSFTGETIYVHPTFLYESLWNLAGFLLLHFLSKYRKYDGQVALQYLAWYGAGRALIEGLRSDSLYIPGTALRVSQVLSIVLCAAALILLLIQSRRSHDPAKLFANQVAAARAAKEAEKAAPDAEAPESSDAPAGEAPEGSTEEATPEAPAAPDGEAAEEAESEDTPESPAPAGDEPPAEASPELPEKAGLWSRFDAWLRS